MPDRKHKQERCSTPGVTPAAKACKSCGRSITWRKKWERDWESVLYCSDACRSHKPSEVDRQLEAAILRLLASRGRDKTICPSEAAKLVGASNTPPDHRTTNRPDARPEWEVLMEPARAAARRLVAQGCLVITQGGQVVDPSTAKGPIRLRLR